MALASLASSSRKSRPEADTHSQGLPFNSFVALIQILYKQSSAAAPMRQTIFPLSIANDTAMPSKKHCKTKVALEIKAGFATYAVPSSMEGILQWPRLPQVTTAPSLRSNTV